MMRGHTGVWVWVGIVAWACAACASGPRAEPAARPRVVPAALLPPSALAFDFQWRQRVSARWPTGQQSFEAVLQKRGGELVLLGLSPLGVPGFVLKLRESGEVEVDNRTGQPLPFEPHFILADVQRVFFPWLAGDAPAAGERSGQRGQTRVSERYANGELVERRFERDTPQGLERVQVHYEAGAPGRDAPARVRLDNPLLGYALTIETLEQTRLSR